LDKVVHDQAEGLRRLLSRAGSRVISVVGGARGIGRTAAVVNLASALAQHGKDVVVIDESGGPRCAAKALGVTPPGTLAGVLTGDRSCAEAVGRNADGVAVLPAPPETQTSFTPAELDGVLHGGADLVLVDALLDPQHGLSPLAARANHIVVVAKLEAESITSAYACVKRLHYVHAIQQFRVLFNGVEQRADAAVAHENLARVASTYLGVSLERAGAVSFDVLVPRASGMGRSVVEAFPMAQAARDFREMAAELLFWPMRPAIPHRASFAEAAGAYRVPSVIDHSVQTA
jgi:flagellar biosynthesis protein FlhG